MNLRDILEKIGNEYLIEKNKKIGGNQFAYFIRHDIKPEIEKNIIDIKYSVNKKNISDIKYSVNSSPGMGVWAIVPWIAIFDIDITEKASNGYYPVYLFSADMEDLYLCLMFSCNGLEENIGNNKEKKEKIKQYFRSKINNKNFNLNTIDLKSNKDLPKKYENAIIIAKKYDLRKLPINDELLNDLKEILIEYVKLKKSINSKENINYYNNIIKEEKEKYEIKGKRLNINHNKVFIKNITKKDTNKKDNNKKKNKNVDFIKEQKENIDLGKAGEDLVYEKEKEILKNANREDLAEKVFLTREKDNTAPYDILSYNKNGEEKYIEVKTTMGNLEEEFYISESEVKFAEEHSENYYLYRIYNFNSKEPNCEIYKGKINREYIEAVKYKTKLEKNNIK